MKSTAAALGKDLGQTAAQGIEQAPGQTTDRPFEEADAMTELSKNLAETMAADDTIPFIQDIAAAEDSAALAALDEAAQDMSSPEPNAGLNMPQQYLADDFYRMTGALQTAEVEERSFSASMMLRLLLSDVEDYLARGAHMSDVVRCLQGAGLRLGTRSIYNYLALARRKYKEEKDPEAAQIKQALLLARQESAPDGMEADAKDDELSALCGEAPAADEPAQAPKEDAAPAAEARPAEAVPAAAEKLMPCPGVPSGTEEQPADAQLAEDPLADALEEPSAMAVQESMQPESADSLDEPAQDALPAAAGQEQISADGDALADAKAAAAFLAEAFCTEAIPAAAEELAPCPDVPSDTEDLLPEDLEEPSAMDFQQSTQPESDDSLDDPAQDAPDRDDALLQEASAPAEDSSEEHFAGSVRAKSAAPARDQKRAAKRKHGHPQRRLNKR